jgi:hypothetical protein
MKLISTGYRLSWRIPDPKLVKNIQLYQMEECSKPVLVKSLSNTTRSHDIAALKKDQVKTYYITYKLQTGGESEGSDVVVIAE